MGLAGHMPAYTGIYVLFAVARSLCPSSNMRLFNERSEQPQSDEWLRPTGAGERKRAGRPYAGSCGRLVVFIKSQLSLYLPSDPYQCVNFRHVTLFLAGMAAA